MRASLDCQFQLKGKGKELTEVSEEEDWRITSLIPNLLDPRRHSRANEER
jgi:hypothetical protein